MDEVKNLENNESKQDSREETSHCEGKQCDCEHEEECGGSDCGCGECNCGCNCGCGCGRCGHCGGYGYSYPMMFHMHRHGRGGLRIVRVILTIAIVFALLSIGASFGARHAERNNFGGDFRGRMGQRAMNINQGDYYAQPQGMMNGQDNFQQGYAQPGNFQPGYGQGTDQYFQVTTQPAQGIQVTPAQTAPANSPIQIQVQPKK